VNARPCWSIEWQTPQGTLRAREPWLEEVRAHADRLAAFYNQPNNRSMLTNTVDMNAGDVEAHFAALAQSGGRPFLLDCDGALAGDADLRQVTDRDAEVAILIGAHDRQGQGLGTRFGIMVHAFAFAVLGLDQVYAAIIPQNAASLRMFEKLGHDIDQGARARAAADDPSDVTTSINRACFRQRHGAAAAVLKFQQRHPGALR
jgi:RimJ/RimL family protein N-acetyltransferase